MKSNYQIAAIVVLSLLLGLSFGQLHEQQRTIDSLRQQNQQVEPSPQCLQGHTRCYRLMRQQRFRYQVKQYEKALRELAEHDILEGSERSSRLHPTITGR